VGRADEAIIAAVVDRERWQLAGAAVLFGHASGGVALMGDGAGFCIAGIILFLLALADMRVRLARVLAMIVLGALGLLYFFLAVAVVVGVGAVAGLAVALPCALMLYIVVVLARDRRDVPAEKTSTPLAPERPGTR
jgi:hypothetical protein